MRVGILLARRKFRAQTLKSRHQRVGGEGRADALDMDLNIARGLYTVHLQDLLSSKECYGKLVIR